MNLQDEQESRDQVSRHISRAILSFFPPAFIYPCCTISSNSYRPSTGGWGCTDSRSICKWMGLHLHFQQQPFLPIHLQVDTGATVATAPIVDPSARGRGCTYSRSICRWMGLHLHFQQQPFLPIHLQVDPDATVATAPIVDPSASGRGCTYSRSICKWMGLDLHLQ